MKTKPMEYMEERRLTRSELELFLVSSSQHFSAVFSPDWRRRGRSCNRDRSRWWCCWRRRCWLRSSEGFSVVATTPPKPSGKAKKVHGSCLMKLGKGQKDEGELRPAVMC
ncbi:unnamed protein product [Rhodiola kirilowii]